jgi:hypothetical protein
MANNEGSRGPGNRAPESQIEGQFHYHYNREEREQGLSEATRATLSKRKGAWWRRNPGQAFTLLDIVIIALVVIVLFPLLNYFSSRPFLGGYNWEGSYFMLEGDDLVILTGDGSREEGTIMGITLLNDSGQELYKTDYLLIGENAEVLLQAELGGASPITIVLEVDEEEKRLYFEGKERSIGGE